MFHLAFPVVNIEETINFYTTVLNAKIGRSASNWADFDLYNNQITAQENNTFSKLSPNIGREGIPVNHFGIILKLSDWHQLKEELIAKNINFLIAPKIVFEGEVGEQYSFFVEDPNGYAIEFKGFADLKDVFSS
jgi:uncharacterized protein